MSLGRQNLFLVLLVCGLLGLALALVAFGDRSGANTPRPSPAKLAEICEEDRYGCVEYGVGDPITLGALLWVGAGADATGIDSERGTELAVDYLDGLFDGIPGELLGHPVQLLVANDGCNAAEGRIGAHTLASQSGLLAVVGTTCSASAVHGAVPVLGARGILMVSPSNTAPELTKPFVGGRFYARTAPNDEIQGAVVAGFAQGRLHAQRAAVLHSADPYSKELSAVFDARFDYLGGRSQDEQVAPGASQAQVESALQRLARFRPQVIYFPVTDPLCARVTRAIAAMPQLAARAITSDGCLSSAMLSSAATLAQPLFVSGPDLSDLNNDPFYKEAFVPAYRERFGERPSAPYHANAFDAANLIFDAARRTAIVGAGDTLAVPRTALRNALSDVVHYDGLSGVLECQPTGDCAQSALIAVYASPAWPVSGGTSDAKPVFSQSKTLAEVQGN